MLVQGQLAVELSEGAFRVYCSLQPHVSMACLCNMVAGGFRLAISIGLKPI